MLMSPAISYCSQYTQYLAERLGNISTGCQRTCLDEYGEKWHMIGFNMEVGIESYKMT